MCEKISKLTFLIVSFDGNNKQFIAFRIYNLLEVNNSYGKIHVQTDFIRHSWVSINKCLRII